MRVANKLTPEPKSKMAKIMPEHTGREQKKLKRCLSLPMRVADKPTPEPILRCFYIQGKSQMLATSRVKQKAKKKLKILEIAGPESLQY